MSTKRTRPGRSKRPGVPTRAFTLRRATRRDLPVLIEHRLGMWREIGGHSETALARHAPAYRRWLDEEWRGGRFVAFLVEGPKGAAAASGALWFVADHPRPGQSARTGYILSIYTDPAFRHQGLASRIVRACVRECRRRKVTRVTLHASKFGRSVYRRLGFERSWEMRRRLAPPR
ncbi:MAG: GNAT family N-acetyltransferase [Thermoplasmata archaeon]|nr:GNAT family N-acetyltransferase [Thermoplasmata archaeon]